MSYSAYPHLQKPPCKTHATTHKYYHTRCCGCPPQGAATGLGTKSSGHTRKPGTHAWSATHHMHCKCQHRHTCQDVTLTFSTDHRHSMQKQAAPTLAVSVYLRCISMPRMEMHASGHETAAQGHFRVPPQQWLQVTQTHQTVLTAGNSCRWQTTWPPKQDGSWSTQPKQQQVRVPHATLSAYRDAQTAQTAPAVLHPLLSARVSCLRTTYFSTQAGSQHAPSHVLHKLSFTFSTARSQPAVPPVPG
jgi:hypothetical protein